MNHENLARQLIRAVRGKRSQVALSRRMKCKSNVLYSWESGRRWPTAAGFFALARQCRVEFGAPLADFLGSPPRDLGFAADYTNPGVVARLLSFLRGTTSVAELSRRVGINRVSVSRFLKATAEPRLPDFLRLVEGSSLRLLDFVAVFVAPDALPEAKAAWQVLEAQRRVAYGLPWSHAVLRAVELSSYRRLSEHREGWIAQRLGIDLGEEQRCLQALAESRLIQRRRKRWAACNVLTVDTRRNPDAGRRLKGHWAEVGRQRLPKLEPNESDLFSYNLFTVSEADWPKVRELHIGYYEALRRLVEKSAPAERVVLANLQLLRLDE